MYLSKKFIILSVILFAFVFVAPALVGTLANASGDYGLSEAARDAGITNPHTAEQSLAVIIGKIISTILSFLGVIFFILMVYGGFMWMTARGNEAQVEKGRKIIMDAILGLIVILLSYAVTALITGELIKAVVK